MLTLRELKNMVVEAEESEKTPHAGPLMESDIPIVVKEVCKCGTEIIVYANGYVVYHDMIQGKKTVFRLHSCGGYLYDNRVNNGNYISHDVFEDQEWYLRLMLEGEDRLEHNQDVREGSHTVSYSAVAEDWGALGTKEDVLEEWVRLEMEQESLEKLLNLMTDKDYVLIMV